RTRKTVPAYSEEAKRLLCAYDWPGNVRELEHTVERLVVLEQKPEIGTDHLPVDIVAAGQNVSAPVSSSGKLQSLKKARANWERQYILGALVQCDWNQTKAAQLLGINRNTLIAKMQQYGLKGAGVRAQAAQTVRKLAGPTF